MIAVLHPAEIPLIMIKDVEMKEGELLSKPLSEIEFSYWPRRVFRRMSLVTLGDLVQKTEEEMNHFGSISLNEIKQKLAELGVSLRK